MRYHCTHRSDFGETSWESEIRILDYILETFECRIQGRGSSYHVIVGRYMNGGFICIPALGICADLADYADILWNTEKLESFLSTVDAITIAGGIKKLRHIRHDQDWLREDD